MHKNQLHIKEGITTRHLIKGLTAAFIGIMPLIQGYWYISVVIWFFAICLILSVEGLYIDLKEHKIWRYTHFLFFKSGKWVPLKPYNRIRISLYKAVNHRHSRTSYNTTVTKSYELFLENSTEEHEELLEHPDYDKVLSLGNQLSRGLNLPLVNYYQEQIDAALKRPRRR